MIIKLLMLMPVVVLDKNVHCLDEVKNDTA